MQSWLYGLGGLEGFLETVFNDPKTHRNFRVFISSEPPALPVIFNYKIFKQLIIYLGI